MSAHVLDMKAINDLHAAGDIDVLAQALRNLIVVTDQATTSAQEAARATQEYVPTVLYKDSLYRALDAALDADAQAKFMAAPTGTVFVDDDDPDYMEYERANDEIGDSFRAALALIPDDLDDWDSLPGTFTTEQRLAFASAAFDLVTNLYCHDWFTVPAQDTETRGCAS